MVLLCWSVGRTITSNKVDFYFFQILMRGSKVKCKSPCETYLDNLAAEIWFNFLNVFSNSKGWCKHLIRLRVHFLSDLALSSTPHTVDELSSIRIEDYLPHLEGESLVRGERKEILHLGSAGPCAHRGEWLLMWGMMISPPPPMLHFHFWLHLSSACPAMT